jgi:hypothetical protein
MAEVASAENRMALVPVFFVVRGGISVPALEPPVQALGLLVERSPPTPFSRPMPLSLKPPNGVAIETACRY